MERLTTAYERILVDESAGMQYVANASDLEVENRLGTYEDAEEARAKAEQLLRQRNRSEIRMDPGNRETAGK